MILTDAELRDLSDRAHKIVREGTYQASDHVVEAVFNRLLSQAVTEKSRPSAPALTLELAQAAAAVTAVETEKKPA